MDSKDYSNSTFLTFPDEKKARLFFDALTCLSELFSDEEIYEVLRNDFELTDAEIHQHALMSDELMLGEGVAIGKPRGDTELWRVFQRANEDKDIFLVHEKSKCMASIHTLRSIKGKDAAKYSTLIDAHIKDSRMGRYGLELVLDGVGPEVLEQFCHDYKAKYETAMKMGGM